MGIVGSRPVSACGGLCGDDEVKWLAVTRTKFTSVQRCGDRSIIAVEEVGGEVVEAGGGAAERVEGAAGRAGEAGGLFA